MNYAHMAADFDLDHPELWRYSLERRFTIVLPRVPATLRSVLFVGLNPSTATHEVDDPTIRREVGFAKAWGYDRYIKANVYALRSTDPKKLYENFEWGCENCLKHRHPDVCVRLQEDGRVCNDKVGPRNKRTIQTLMDEAELIVACWGANKLHEGAVDIAKMIMADPRTRCLGLTKDGAPRHPLYLPKTTPLQMVAPGKGYVAL